MVTGGTPNSFANQTPVLFFSTKVSFNRFNSLTFLFNELKSTAKLLHFSNMEVVVEKNFHQIKAINKNYKIDT